MNSLLLFYMVFRIVIKYFYANDVKTFNCWMEFEQFPVIFPNFDFDNQQTIITKTHAFLFNFHLLH